MVHLAETKSLQGNNKGCAPRNMIELTEGNLLSCTNAIETSAWFMINSTALGPVRHKFRVVF